MWLAAGAAVFGVLLGGLAVFLGMQERPVTVPAPAPAQAPVQVLPELPALLHNFLRANPADSSRAIEELLVEQRRTNKLLQGLVYAVAGFALGMVVMQLVIRVRLF